MQNQPFSVATDGSNDMDNMKLYPQWLLDVFIYITFYIGSNGGF